jgi:hypothetical protein
VLGAVAALVALAAGYLVVEATAVPAGADVVPAEFSPWTLAVLQVVLPLAACAPVAYAMQTAL